MNIHQEIVKTIKVGEKFLIKKKFVDGGPLPVSNFSEAEISTLEQSRFFEFRGGKYFLSSLGLEAWSLIVENPEEYKAIALSALASPSRLEE
jgi:hypothetical protein